MKNISFRNLLFYVFQSVKYYLMKLLTFHLRKVKTGVLLIRCDNLGDLLISLPLFEQISGYVQKENKTVTIVVSDSMASFCRTIPYFDNVVSLPLNKLNNFFGRIKSYRLITRFCAEKTILFHILGRSGEYDYMALLPKSKEKYAVETMDVWPIRDAVGKYRKNFFNQRYTFLFHYNISKPLSYNECELVRYAMKKPIEQRLGNISFLYPLPAMNVSDFPYYLVVPGSSASSRQWPVKNFASLVDHIFIRFPGLVPVLIGSKKDTDVAEKVLELCQNKEKIINLCGKTSLKELFSIIEKAEFLITNDTGAYHVASLVKTKTFCIGGSWHFGAYGPNPLYSQCVYIYKEMQCKYCMERCDKVKETYPCLEQITASEVFDIIIKNYNGTVV